MTTPEVRQPREVPHQNELEQAIELYNHSDFFLDHSGNTHLAYTADLAQFQTYCKKKDISEIRQIKSEDIRNWQDQLRQAGKAPATINRMQSSLSGFLGWAQAEGIILPRFEPVMKKQPIILSAEQVDSLISKAKNLRDASLILISLKTGATITEIVNLNAEDILETEDGNTAIRFKGGVKRSQPRTLEVDKEAGSKIAEYIEESGLEPEDPLFPSRYGHERRLTRAGATNAIFRNYAVEIGVENLNSRILRDTFIANFTGTPRQLAEALGKKRA